MPVVLLFHKKWLRSRNFHLKWWFLEFSALGGAGGVSEWGALKIHDWSQQQTTLPGCCFLEYKEERGGDSVSHNNLNIRKKERVIVYSDLT